MEKQRKARKPLTIEKRHTIKKMLNLGRTYKEIADALQVSISAISYEISRFPRWEEYDPIMAQEDYKARKIKKEGFKLTNNDSWLSICNRLKDIEAKVEILMTTHSNLVNTQNYILSVINKILEKDK